MSKPEITVIVGPTSSGKTDLAISMAKEMDGSVISADSRQVYAGMNIGVAKPKEAFRDEVHDVLVPDQIEGVPHYLLNIAKPDNPISLSGWQQDAFTAINHVLSSNNHPILCGGTMLYTDSIAFNYDIPSVEPDSAFRSSLERKHVDDLYSELLERDPKASSFVESHHKQRIIRALEVIEVTGKPFSEQRKSREPLYDVDWIGLFPGWDELKSRLEERTHSMVEAGLIEETKRLQETYSPDLPLLQTMMYKEAGLVLSGNLTQEEAITEMIRVQLRYARRQMSWWKRNAEIKWG